MRDPILIEGLPGIGLVANIAALHLIKELKAKRFVEIKSDSFQSLAVLTKTGDTRSPINELYYCKMDDCDHDLIIWYGNTQALTTYGQYELCGKVLDLAKELGCRFVISLGGFKKEEIKAAPVVYCAASDTETLKEALALGTKIMVGNIFGIAGLSIGLGRLRDFRGFTLLVETLGMSPDVSATRRALTALSKYLKLSFDMSSLENTAEQTKNELESFGLIVKTREKKKKEEQQMRWFI